MAQGGYGMVKQHPGAGKAHDCADSFPHFRFVAMYLAVGAERLRLHEGTFIAALSCVGVESGAFRAETAAGGKPLLELLPWKLKTAAIITTGSEVAKGLIQDSFTPVVEKKLAEFGIQTIHHCLPGDDIEAVKNAVLEAKAAHPDLILCTGGMSVDPDDNTPGAVKRSGARIVAYGAPVLPGAMFLLGYFQDGTPVAGLPGCVMYAKRTIFDLVLPKLAAGVPITREDITVLGEGGLCLSCEVCTYPNCGFGK